MNMKKSLSNKGFSLVELIIVIAIMAVLVGVLAPQFTKYVAKSKSSTDTQNVEALQSAANSVLADETLNLAADFSATSGKYVIKAGAVDATTTATLTSSNFKTLLETALGTNDAGAVKYPTAKKDTTKTFVITITGTATSGYSASCTLN